jgi:hypothetical protein
MAIDKEKIHRLSKYADLLKRLAANADAQELIESLTDPEMLDMIKSVVVPNGNHAAGHQQSQADNGHQPKKRSKPLVRGVLTKEVGNLIPGFPGTFTVRKIIQILEERDFTFRSKNPVVAVNDILKLLAVNGVIRVAKQGAGRTPSEYERIEKGSTVKA